MSFIRVLFDSFTLLKKCPRLFIPKILVAFFLLPIFILVPHFLFESGILSISLPITRAESIALMGGIIPLFFVVLYGLMVDLFDFFVVNPMYPLLVRDFYRGKGPRFRQSLERVLQRFDTIFPALLTVLLITFAVLTPTALLSTIAVFMQEPPLIWVSVIAGFLSVFALFVLFYLIYPISSLEGFKFLPSLRHTLRVSLKHKVNVSKAFLVSLLITFLSYFLGFLITWFSGPDNLMPRLGIFLLFILTRWLVALLSTYQYVLNAVFYLGLEKGQFLRSI